MPDTHTGIVHMHSRLSKLHTLTSPFSHPESRTLHPSFLAFTICHSIKEVIGLLCPRKECLSVPLVRGHGRSFMTPLLYPSACTKVCPKQFLRTISTETFSFRSCDSPRCIHECTSGLKL